MRKRVQNNLPICEQGCQLPRTFFGLSGRLSISPRRRTRARLLGGVVHGPRGPSDVIIFALQQSEQRQGDTAQVEIQRGNRSGGGRRPAH